MKDQFQLDIDHLCQNPEVWEIFEGRVTRLFPRMPILKSDLPEHIQEAYTIKIDLKDKDALAILRDVIEDAISLDGGCIMSTGPLDGGGHEMYLCTITYPYNSRRYGNVYGGKGDTKTSAILRAFIESEEDHGEQ